MEHWQSFLALVNMIMFCTGIPGHYPVNETTSSLTLTFWYTLQVRLVPGDTQPDPAFPGTGLGRGPGWRVAVLGLQLLWFSMLHSPLPVSLLLLPAVPQQGRGTCRYTRALLLGLGSLLQELVGPGQAHCCVAAQRGAGTDGRQVPVPPYSSGWALCHRTALQSCPLHLADLGLGLRSLNWARPSCVLVEQLGAVLSSPDPHDAGGTPLATAPSGSSSVATSQGPSQVPFIPVVSRGARGHLAEVI